VAATVSLYVSEAWVICARWSVATDSEKSPTFYLLLLSCSIEKARFRRAFSMEAPGIEPGSRDVLAAASTCVVGVLFLAASTRTDAVLGGQGGQMSPAGNRPTPAG